MTELRSNDKLFGNLSLALLVTGLLIPFIIAIFADRAIAIGYGGVSLVLALLFGLIGFREKTAKVSVLTTGCLVVLTIATTGVLLVKRRAKMREGGDRLAREIEATAKALDQAVNAEQGGSAPDGTDQ